MRKFVIGIAAISLSACSITIPIGGSRLEIPTEEMIYQSVSAVDFSTTINVARLPDCYYEDGWPTAQIIGRHPTVEHVYEYWAATALIHLAISNWLLREAEATGADAWSDLYGVWQLGTIGYSAYNAGHNLALGERPFGAGHSNNVSIVGRDCLRDVR